MECKMKDWMCAGPVDSFSGICEVHSGKRPVPSENEQRERQRILRESQAKTAEQETMRIEKMRLERRAHERADQRLKIATHILGAMIASSPVVDRTTVDKKLWSNIALTWADVLMREASRL